MKPGKRCHWLAAPAWLGLLLQAHTALAQTHAPPARSAALPPSQTAPRDVALDGQQGILHGMVVNVAEVGVAGAEVILSQNGQDVAGAQTDAEGRFAMHGLHGGVYRVSSGDSAVMTRLWSAGTAPATAQHSVRLLAATKVVRGQSPLGRLCTSDAFVMTGVVAAAIAIPIAVHNARHRKAGS